MKSGANLLTQAFIYDFAVNGGAVGSITTGVQLPSGALVQTVAMCVMKQVTGGAGYVYNVGTSASHTLFGTHAGGGAINPGWLNTGLTPGIMDATLNILFSISVAAITAGKMFFVFGYYFPE